jgi:LmbE family N-acetylglucosaminyl deacetylase
MELVVDRDHCGPDESEWLQQIRTVDIAPMPPLDVRRLVIVAPHPDDEVLGAGGLIMKALADDVKVHVVAVTNGEGSHPGSQRFSQTELARLRAAESTVALRRLGWEKPRCTRLDLPDGRVADHRSTLYNALTSLLSPNDVCVMPWRLDGHPDHDVCGDVARAVCNDASVQCLYYPIWLWHWARPIGNDVPWNKCLRLDLSRRE